MTVIQEITRADGTKVIKTEVRIIEVNHVLFTRVINSKIFVVEMKRNEAISVAQVSRLCKIDDELFSTFAEI